MQLTIPTRGDVPSAIAMATFFLTFGLVGIVFPGRLRKAMDSFSDTWKKGSWHPYRMPLPLLQWIVGSVGIAGAALFLYIGYLGLAQ
jgi:hypothetical protein